MHQLPEELFYGRDKEKDLMPRWLSLVERRFRKAQVGCSNHLRGFIVFYYRNSYKESKLQNCCMGLKDRDVMVIGRGILFPHYREVFDGFKSKAEFDYSKLILSEPRFVPKQTLGIDDRQIFSYVAFFNNNGEVYTFLREDGRVSVYIEGSVCFEDASNDSIRVYRDTLKAGAMREIKKQIGVSERTSLINPGFINLEESKFRDRFGILYFALTQSKEIVTHSRRTRVVPISFDGKRDLSKLEELCREDKLDACSKAILEPLSTYRDFI